MSKRLFFLVPNVPLARKIVDELAGAGIPERHLHAVASHAVDLEDLPEASAVQKSEFLHGIEAGLGVGGTAGLLSGLLAVTFPPAGLVLGGAAIVAGTLAGAGLGAVVSALVARDVPNHELKVFEGAIAEGNILLLVDVPKARVDEFQELIIQHHPEVEIVVTQAPPKG